MKKVSDKEALKELDEHATSRKGKGDTNLAKVALELYGKHTETQGAKYNKAVRNLQKRVDGIQKEVCTHKGWHREDY